MPVSDYKPAVDAVGSILRARTKDDSGNEIGTFNDNTRPTGTEVGLLIDQAVSDLSDVIGEDLPTDALKSSAKSLAAIGSAMLVEISYFPEQVAHDHSVYDRLERWYNARLKRLEEAAGEAGDSTGEVVPGTGGMPSYDYPEDGGGLVGWGTRW